MFWLLCALLRLNTRLSKMTAAFCSRRLEPAPSVNGWFPCQQITSSTSRLLLSQEDGRIPSPARQHDVVPEAAAVRAPGTESGLGNGPAAPVRGLPG